VRFVLSGSLGRGDCQNAPAESPGAMRALAGPDRTNGIGALTTSNGPEWAALHIPSRISARTQALPVC
jgi:hypothetical protein